jgi:hypothetical protein
MKMTTTSSRRPLVSVLTAISLVWVSFQPALLQAQEQGTLGWDSVLRLRFGERVGVATDAGKFTGVVGQVDPEWLSMTTQDKQQLLFPREKVKSVAYAGKHAKLGAWLIVGGFALVAADALISTGQDLDSVSSGGVPENHNHALTIAGFGVSIAGVFTLLKGGARTIYQRTEREEKASTSR